MCAVFLPFIFYCSYIGKGDGITISVWNHKKIHKKQGGGFLGCVRIMSNTIQRLKDTGCKYFCILCIILKELLKQHGVFMSYYNYKHLKI